MPTLPSVDIVIPTLNCRRLLSKCLACLISQDYPGHTRIVLMDGGSTDGTIELGRSMGCDVFVRNGMFSTGLSGARNIALGLCTGELTWQIDVDNLIPDKHTLSRLVKPFLSIKELQLSMPVIKTSQDQSGLDCYMASLEHARVFRMAESGKANANWIVMEDASYGIANATLIRTSLLIKVGGYDSDVRVLRRARKLGLSRAVIVQDASYIHLQAETWTGWVRKMVRRVRHYSNLTPKQLNEYFVPSSRDHSYRQHPFQEISDAFSVGFQLWRKGEEYWIWGFLLIIGWFAVFLMSPRSLMRTYVHFL